MAMSPLAGSPSSFSLANSRPIGETGELHSSGGSGNLVRSCGSNQPSIANALMDTSTAKILAQQEIALQAHSAANQQQSPSESRTSSRLVGTTENHLGVVHGGTRLFGHVMQPGTALAVMGYCSLCRVACSHLFGCLVYPCTIPWCKHEFSDFFHLYNSPPVGQGFIARRCVATERFTGRCLVA